MRTCLACLVLLIALPHSVSAQDHLEPDVDAFVDPDSYLLKIRHIFARAFDEGVILRVLVLPSFRDEYAVGLKQNDNGIEAFVLEPSSMIWNTELIKMYEDGEIVETTRDGEAIPPAKSAELKKLKATTPADYRDIKAARRVRAIPGELSAEIKAIWTEMLLDVRHPKEAINGLDGVEYHFSMWLQGRGDMSGHAWSPRPGSKVEGLTALAEALADFARGKADLSALKKKVEQAKKSTKP